MKGVGLTHKPVNSFVASKTRPYTDHQAQQVMSVKETTAIQENNQHLNKSQQPVSFAFLIFGAVCINTLDNKFSNSLAVHQIFKV